MVGIEPTSEKLKTELLQAYLIYNIFSKLSQSTGKFKVRSGNFPFVPLITEHKRNFDLVYTPSNQSKSNSRDDN